MRLTAILRFSDSEVAVKSTIQAHNEIIDQGGQVWWGWWKKKTEDPNLDLLKRLQSEVRRKSSLRIGLVNRKGADTFYVATCVEIVYGEGGATRPSPNANITPAY